jgi:hypothetical protein
VDKLLRHVTACGWGSVLFFLASEEKPHPQTRPKTEPEQGLGGPTLVLLSGGARGQI